MAATRDLKIIFLICASYLLGFLLFYPNNLKNADEVAYIRQAELFAKGQICANTRDIASQKIVCNRPSRYPPGTSILLTPLIWIFGWKGSFILPALSLIGATLLCAAWLKSAQLSPNFALMLILYPPSLVMGRTAMSDTSSLLLITCALFLFWNANHRKAPLKSFGAGLCGGISSLFREPNILLLTPLLIGAIVRQKKYTILLILGGFLGISLRLISASIIFDDAFYVKDPGRNFSLEHITANILPYSISLLIFYPAGLIGVLFYRGNRAIELIASVMIFFLFFLIYGYAASESGILKQLILSPRFLIPLGPIIAFCSAETLPRLVDKIQTSIPKLFRLPNKLIHSTLVALATITAFLVHPALAFYEQKQDIYLSAILKHIPPQSVIITNSEITNKVMFPVRNLYNTFDTLHWEFNSIITKLHDHHEIYLLVIDRAESEEWVTKSGRNNIIVEKMKQKNQLSLLVKVPGFEQGEQLRIWRINSD